jgi:two-component system, NarL family, sensor histidine kinase UhpB
VSQPRTLPLYWRVVLTNGVVFVLGTLALAFGPVTVSEQVLVSEAIVLGVGLAVILVTNALLLLHSLAPLDRLAARMAVLDRPGPEERLPEEGVGVVGELITAYNAMLTSLEQERSTSNARAIAAQETERQRVARELHDEIGQSLTVVLLGLKRVLDRAPDEIVADLGAVQDAARSSLVDVRRVARRLRPGVLDDLGLLSALSALTSDVSQHSKVHVRRRFAPGLPPLDAETELVVYRVAQEALTNVSRHAEARTVDVTLSKLGEALELVVADDGTGLRGAVEGSGIHGMRERAHLVEGRFEIGPRPGGGTQVRLVVPLRAPS